MASDATALSPAAAIDWILNALVEAHERPRSVGGLFNGYEVALHYELFSAALRRGLHDTRQEEPLGHGQTSCDLVLPLVGGRWLWLEVKQWWFLDAAYQGGRYANQDKTRSWLVNDWMKLRNSHHSKDHEHALLLMRTWDTEDAYQLAEDWRGKVDSALSGMGARQHDPRPLKEHVYVSAKAYDPKREANWRRGAATTHTRRGDLITWSSLA